MWSPRVVERVKESSSSAPGVTVAVFDCLQRARHVGGSSLYVGLRSLVC